MSSDEIKRLEKAHKKGVVSDEALANIRKWLDEKQYADFRDEILDLIRKKEFSELNDSFYTIIPFGTGGRRGPCGPGPNRMNKRTIGESAQGLAAYIEEHGDDAKQRGVAVAHDTRLTSREFAEETARVLAGNGVKVFLFDSFRSTPELSFAVRHLNAIAGVVISASHNPPRDNGFKAYWEDGGQVVPPHDKSIIERVQQVEDIAAVPLDEAKSRGLLAEIGKDVDDVYIGKVAGVLLTDARDVDIMYSPLHGTGITNIVPALEKAGFADVKLVEAQATPDGNFPNVPDHFPNPELPAAMQMVMEEGKAAGSDIAIASDPDADRLGCAVPGLGEDWVRLNGNQIGALITEFILSERQKQDTLPEHSIIARTLVTTPLISAIANAYGVDVEENLLVGFKYIGELIENLDEGIEFLFGAEESHGYLAGTFVRDKDSAIAAVLMAELAADLKRKGKTVYGHLLDIFRKYGCYAETLKNVYLTGQEGSEQIQHIMTTLRKEAPMEIGGHVVDRMIDRQTGKVIDIATKVETGEVQGAKGNVLVFCLKEGGEVTVRPSGTEPKAKFYVTLNRPVDASASDEAVEKLSSDVAQLADDLGEAVLDMAKKIAEGKQ
ncbi:MAG: phospho-sugar mutase [Planctomycetes bacterium]|nr:phospho-sugar mutase [Planctomycetota bacterium]